MEEWKDGSMEGWKDGRVEGWKDGRMEGWKDGRVQAPKARSQNSLGQAKAGFGRSAALDKRKRGASAESAIQG